MFAAKFIFPFPSFLVGLPPTPTKPSFCESVTRLHHTLSWWLPLTGLSLAASALLAQRLSCQIPDLAAYLERSRASSLPESSGSATCSSVKPIRKPLAHEPQFLGFCQYSEIATIHPLEAGRHRDDGYRGRQLISTPARSPFDQGSALLEIYSLLPTKDDQRLEN